MKKVTLFSLLFFFCIISHFGQTITLTFLGEDAETHNNLTIDSVYIRNTTLECDTIIYGEIPSITVTYSLGIDDPEFSNSEPFSVLPPVPNPFTGSTNVQIILNHSGKLHLSLLDLSGIELSSYKNDFLVGLHRFEIKSPTNGILLLKVSNGSDNKTIKLICNGNGIGENKINYLGNTVKTIKTAFAGGFKFQLGNQLLYKSIKTGYDDAIIIDSPTQNKTYIFVMTQSSILPSVITSTVSNPTQTTATSGGEVTSDGGAAITARGVCWSTTPNPTILNGHTTDGTGVGSFISNITNLTANTSYFLRAYATNTVGIEYGNQHIFSTLAELSLPSVTTSTIINYTQTTATSGGNVIYDGGSTVTARGVCWSIFPNPTLSDNHTTDGSGTGAFTSYLTGLAPNTYYYVRAYATNYTGTSYGNQLTFTTAPAVSCGFQVTYEGQIYNTIQIGNQCWIKENLNVGIRIDGNTPQAYNDIIEKYCYNDLETNCSVYGGLYQWNEMMNYCVLEGAKGICPPGWHIASNREYDTLGNFCGGQTIAGGPMKESGFIHWSYPNSGATNLTGFTGLPGGMSVGGYYGLTLEGNIWTSNQTDYLSGNYRRMDYQNFALSYDTIDKTAGLSIRCILGNGPDRPTVITSAVVNIDSTTATCGGNVTFDGGSQVISRGVCWSISPNPTIGDGHTIDGSGTGPFVSNLTGLTPNTQYYLRAYATNGWETGYGDQESFFTAIPCPGVPRTFIYQGQTYSTVKIGSQCWIRENLNVGAKINGSINQSDNGVIEKYCYDDLYSNCDIYGGLYQWDEMMQYITEEGTSGICPVGWHSPTYQELTTLNTYLGASAGGKMKEVGTSHWNLPNAGATNESGFTALPGGRRSSAMSFEFLASAGHYWSSTQTSENNARRIILSSESPDLFIAQQEKTIGMAVRCLTSTGGIAVTTSSVTNITLTTATSGGNVSSESGDNVTARGVCWDISSNPTTANSHTTDGSGMGPFTSYLTGLTPNTLYYVRAYATNSAGTSYGNQQSFTTESTAGPCGDPMNIIHVAGNVAPVNKTTTYGTVNNIPGELSKCWITSNLGSDHQATSVSDNTEPSAGWYWQFNLKQGYKHDGTTVTPAWTITSISENSDWLAANDPCTIELGTGWRIPTYTEWQNVDNAGDWSNWYGPWNSGLKLHAAGYLKSSDCSLLLRGTTGSYWSSSQNDNSAGRHLIFYSGFCIMDNAPKAYGFTLRCLRD